MRNKDLILLSLIALLILFLLGQTLVNPHLALLNFGDLYSYHYPLRHLVAETLQEGRLPFWNPYIFAGTPLLANPQTAVFYPVSLLGFFFPLTLAFSWDYAFHIFWAALGVWLLARAFRLPGLASLSLALFYALSPFLIFRVTEGIPTLLAGLSWVPWCYLAWIAADAWLLGGVLALQFLSGHPQFLIINALGMAILALTRGRAGTSKASRLAIAALFATCLAAAIWPLTWQFMAHSVRRLWGSKFGLGYSWPPRLLRTWIFPNALGNPLAPGFSGLPSVFFESSSLFFGFSGTALVLVGLRRGWRRGGPVLALSGIFFALGRHNSIARFLIMHTPLSFLRTPSRFLLLDLWGLLLLAGAGLADMKSWPRRKLFYAATALLIGLELGFWSKRFLKPQETGQFLGYNPAIAQALGNRPLRAMTDPGLANPDKTMLYRIMNVNGYDAFYPAEFAFWAAQSEGRPAADPSRSYLSRINTPQMRRLGVADFIKKTGRLRLARGPRALAFFARGQNSVAFGHIGVRVERPEIWRFQGTVPARGFSPVAAVPFYPGWQAYINGKPADIRPWDGFLQSILLSKHPRAGTLFSALLIFVPSLWILWLCVCIVSWLLWLLVATKKAAHLASC
ncbi:MAG: hypothetical protein ACYCPQ_01815 [Elusimicrobiota bacterium]